MSIRTIVEFNHDMAHRIEADRDQFVRDLLEALRTGSEAAWVDLKVRYGVRMGAVCHHSDDRFVIVNDREYRIG